MTDDINIELDNDTESEIAYLKEEIKKLTDFRNEVGTILHLMRLLAYDNNMNLKPYNKWPKFINYSLLESQAFKLSDSEKELYIMGEDKEAEFLTNKYGIKVLNKFIDEAFNGPLSSYYFE